MTPPGEVIVVPLVRDRRRVLTDSWRSPSARGADVLVTTLVATTSASPARRMGAVAAPGPPAPCSPRRTLALNQYWERDVDARMERTRARPLPDGRLMPLEARVRRRDHRDGIVYLAAFVGCGRHGDAGDLRALPLRVHPAEAADLVCTIVGAVPGALPPVTAGRRAESWASGRDPFGILFLWQLPHTLAIGRLYRTTTARAGVRLLPVIIRTGRAPSVRS